MDIRVLFSCALLGIFLLFSSLPSFSLSQSNHKFSSRRLLKSSSQRNKHNSTTSSTPQRCESKTWTPSFEMEQEIGKFRFLVANQRRRDCDLVHSNSNHGENLFWGSGKNWNLAEAGAAWAAEKSCYNHKTNSCSGYKDCLHYTQDDLETGLKVGCAGVVCKSGDTFVTCTYDPRGTVIGQKPF